MYEHGNTDDDTNQSRLDFTSPTLFLDVFRLRQQGVELTEFERKSLVAAANGRQRKLNRDRTARAQQSLARAITAEADPTEQVIDRLDTLIDLLRPQPEQPRRRPASRPNRPPPEFNSAPTQRHRIDL